MVGLVRTFLTDREILNGLAIILDDTSEHILSHQALERIQMSYMPQIFRNNALFRTSERPYPKKVMTSFNVKTDFKRYKVLQGTTCVWKCKIFSKNLSSMLSIPMMTCGTNFLNTLYYLDSEKQTQWSDSADTQADLYLYWSHMLWAGFVKIRLIHKAEHNVPDEWNANVLMRKGLKILTHISLAFLFFGT